MGNELIRGINFPANGVYHRLLETSLAAHDFASARVNPRQARRFAEGAGSLAKTDRVEAAMLARMGSLLELKADNSKSETLHDLKEMQTARQTLIKDRTAASARLKTAIHPLMKNQSALRLRQVELDLAQIDATIKTIITADKILSEKADILISMPRHCNDNCLCDADRNARTGLLEQKANRESGRSCTNLTPIRFSVMQASPASQGANGRAKSVSRAGEPVCEG